MATSVAYGVATRLTGSYARPVTATSVAYDGDARPSRQLAAWKFVLWRCDVAARLTGRCTRNRTDTRREHTLGVTDMAKSHQKFGAIDRDDISLSCIETLKCGRMWLESLVAR